MIILSPPSRHPAVSREAWLAARVELLKKEKELTHLRDRLNAERRDLPWVKVEKEYRFDGPGGCETLADLFGDCSQLIVQHFMFGPGWEEGCVGCSFLSDHIDGALVHLENHDVSLVVISRAAWPEIEAYKRRMGWRFKWVSSFGSDFNFDYHVSFSAADKDRGSVFYNYQLQPYEIEELAGHSVFYRESGSGEIFHTYSTYGRGDEHLMGAYNYLDFTPKGRNETGPNFDLGDWARHHDRYGAGGCVDATGRYQAAQSSKCCASSEARP